MRSKHLITAALIFGVLLTAPANAQHPIDVQRLSAKGEHFDALVAYQKLPKRRTTSEAVNAAARSAWALSLPKLAIEEFDKVLQDKNLDQVERARVYLSRGIIEFQEDRFQVAQLYAEKSLALLDEPSPLRSKVWFLWGESLERLGQYGPAEEKYAKALEESLKEEKGDIYFSLGSCQLRLGKFEKARENFEQVPLRHDKTDIAMRRLAQLALQAGQHEQAEFWLIKGRSDYPESFLDSWVDYAMLKIAIKKNDRQQAEEVTERARKQYPPSDPWLVLLESVYAQYRWKSSSQIED
ncbi:MAG: tetratricopeptide repeat protein [Deltaproteobacteria bacterium]|nr:tetratricopeptide repeat protein [Deltaproteobacteria bacterium]